MDQRESGLDAGERGEAQLGGAVDAAKIVADEEIAPELGETPQRQAHRQDHLALPVGAERQAAGVEALAPEQHPGRGEEAQIAAQQDPRHFVAGIEIRQHDGDLPGRLVVAQALEIHRREIGKTVVAIAPQVEFAGQPVLVGEVEPAEIPAVGGGDPVEAPPDAAGQVELAARLDVAVQFVAALVVVAGQAAGGGEVAAGEGAAVFDDPDDAVPAGDEWAEGQVGMIVDDPVIGHPGAVAVDRGLAEFRHQEAAGAFHRRVGVAEIRQPGDRHAEHIEGRVLVVDHPLDLVVDHPPGADAPQRYRVVGANLARTVDRLGKHVEAGLDAARLGRRELDVLAHHGARAAHQPVAQIGVQIGEIGEHGRPRGVAQHDGAGRGDPPGGAVVDDPVGGQGALAVIDLDIAAGGQKAGLGVVFHQVGAQRHR